jgi:3-oxoacyl-[acyl-carrier protein] reductase
VKEFEGKVVLVTGASSGIGAEVAKAFGERGARVAVHFHNHKEEAVRVAAWIAEHGGTAAVFQADVTDSGEVDRMVEDVYCRFGRVDVLVNNAGGFVARARIADATDELIDDVFRLNARSVVMVSRRVIPRMSANGGGAIINVTTQAARSGGGPGAGLYAACKAFVSTLTRTLAKELAGDKIRVNAVAPGVIDTPFHDGHSSPDILKTFANAIPMGRLGTAEECVGAFLYLADASMSGYVTGQVLEVNGGQIMP